MRSEAFDSFKKSKDYLVCVDSDGCAMDTMNIKHFQCFGPCMVEEWGLEPWRDTVLKRWNEINLYTMTRGINRFKGLAMQLAEINANITAIKDVATLIHWTNTASELSNRSLEAEIERTHSVIMKKALQWSTAVNQAIASLSQSDKKAFAHVAEGLQAAQAFADVAVVSSANRDAVLKEWQENELLDHVDIVLAQDAGSKAHCIAGLLKKGYAQSRVLMVGDAPGDLKAAETNGVHFYPILVREEAHSWEELWLTGLLYFQKGVYDNYEKTKVEQFFGNLKGD